MRTILKFLGFALLAVVGAATLFAAYVAISGIPKYTPGRIERKVEITPEKVERGRYSSVSEVVSEALGCLAAQEDG